HTHALLHRAEPPTNLSYWRGRQHRRAARARGTSQWPCECVRDAPPGLSTAFVRRNGYRLRSRPGFAAPGSALGLGDRERAGIRPRLCADRAWPFQGSVAPLRAEPWKRIPSRSSLQSTLSGSLDFANRIEPIRFGPRTPWSI